MTSHLSPGSIARDVALRLLTMPLATRAVAPLMKGRATVFMLHRFSMPDLGISGHDPLEVRKLLGYLRKHRFEVVSIDDLLTDSGRWSASPRPVVSFTIDDGYVDQGEIGVPLFAEFDCPSTIFLTTGFMDGALWQWWDRIRYGFEGAPNGAVTSSLDEEQTLLTWETPEEARHVAGAFIERLKAVPDEARVAAVDEVCRQLDVPDPTSPPPPYRPMTWARARTCEVMGTTFGPHTVTHPILSRTNEAQGAHEIIESWKRLQAELSNPVPVFCYPNGKPADQGQREVRILESAGFAGAVIASEGHMGLTPDALGGSGRFLVPRFPFTDRTPQAIQYASGVERLKDVIRG